MMMMTGADFRTRGPAAVCVSQPVRGARIWCVSWGTRRCSSCRNWILLVEWCRIRSTRSLMLSSVWVLLFSLLLSSTFRQTLHICAFYFLFQAFDKERVEERVNDHHTLAPLFLPAVCWKQINKRESTCMTRVSLFHSSSRLSLPVTHTENHPQSSFYTDTHL